MSFEQRKVVDCIGIGKADGRVILAISDHLPWLPDNEHLLFLQDRINDYVEFIESGEIYDSYPEARGREIESLVICKYLPVGDAIRFLESAGQIVRRAGLHFSTQAFRGSDDDEC